MQTQMQSHTSQTLVEVFDSVLAGRAASDAMSAALCQEWLPAMAALLDRPESTGEHGIYVRRLLVRLGWLLQHLPQAQSIHASVLDRAIRECRSDWQALAPLLFADAKTRARHTDLLEGELLDCLQVTGDSHAYRPVVARSPLATIMAVRATPAAMSPRDHGVPAAWLQVLAEGRVAIMG